jgi:hypothetical protein
LKTVFQLPKNGGRSRQGASRPHDPKDRFDEAAVVTSAAPVVRRLTQTMRLHPRPLGVCQYESFHPKLESQPSQRGKLEAERIELWVRGVTAEPFGARGAILERDPGRPWRLVQG